MAKEREQISRSDKGKKGNGERKRQWRRAARHALKQAVNHGDDLPSKERRKYFGWTE